MLCVRPRECGLWLFTLVWASYFIPLHQLHLSNGIGWLWGLMTMLKTFWARHRAGAQRVESYLCVCTVCVCVCVCVCTQCVHTCVCTCAFPPYSSLGRKHRCLARWKNTRPGYDSLHSCSANIHFPPPSHSGWSLQPLPTERLGHVTCFGHWNVSGCGLRRCLECVQAACLALLFW